MSTQYRSTCTAITVPVSATIWIGPVSNGSGTLCAVAYGAAYSITSTDNGSSWTNHTLTGAINRVAFVHDGTNFITIQSAGTSLQYSADGATWTGVTVANKNWSTLLVQGSRITAFANGQVDTIYSTNHGVSWSTGTSLANADGGYASAASPTAAVTVTLGAGKHAHRSTDSWITNSAIASTYLCGSVVYDSTNGVFVASGASTDAGHSMRSTDDGQSWGAGGDFPHAIAYNLTYFDGAVYATPGSATGGFTTIYKSTDGGQNWVSDGDMPSAAVWRGWYCSADRQVFVGTTTLAAYRQVDRSGTSALIAQSALLSGTGLLNHLHTSTADLTVQAAVISSDGLVSFPGSHASGPVILLASHAAMNASGTRVAPQTLSGDLIAQSALMSASATLTRAPSLFIAKFDSLTGTPKIQILRIRDSTTYDSSDSTYKASPTLANAQMTMTQINATLWPTYYSKSVDNTNWTDGEYMTHAVDDGDSTNYRFDSYIYKNGALYYGGLLTDERAAVFLAASPTGNLTVEEHNALITGIPNSIAALPTAAANAAATLDRYKRVLNPADGTIKLYDQAGNLAYSGLAYMDAAGTRLYDGTAAVHHTTFLT